jgi:2'-5' RNA ligase
LTVATAEIDRDEYEGWVEDATAASVLAFSRVRKRIAGKVGQQLPGDPSSVYSAAWWDAEMPTLQAAYESVASESGRHFADQVDPDGTIDDDRMGVIAAGVAAAFVGLLLTRGDIVDERVTQLIEQGTEAGWDGDRFSQEMGLDGEGGPLGDSLGDGYGITAATAMTEGMAGAVADELGLSGTVTWNCIFHNSRDTHIEADGQTVAIGETFTIGGFDARYPCDPDLPVEESVNCVIEGTGVSASAVRAGFRRSYSGPVVRIRTWAGNDLTVTPNHPVLTQRGWVAAGELDPRCDLIYRFVADPIPAGTDPEVDHQPVAEFFDSLLELRPAERVVGSPMDFHGDGREAEVEVVSANGLLRTSDMTARSQAVDQLLLVPADELRRLFPAARSTGQLVGVGLGAAAGGVSVHHNGREAGLAGDLSAGAASAFDAGRDQAGRDCASVDAQTSGERLLALSGPVAVDQVLDIEWSEFTGHVYNLTTSSGWYLANGLIVHNCQCYLSYETASGQTIDAGSAEFATVPQPRFASGDNGRSNEELSVGAQMGVIRRLRTRTFNMAESTPASVYVTVEPTPQERASMAREGGQAPGQLHLTLAFLGTVDQFDETQKLLLRQALAVATAETGPMTGTVSGIGYFGMPGENTLALVNSKGLAAFRTALVNALAERGLTVDEGRDFQPHITLGYGDFDAASLVGSPLTFNEVRLRFGDEIHAFDLIGSARPPEPSTGETEEFEIAPFAQEATVYEVVSDHPECRKSVDGPVGLVDNQTGELVGCFLTADAAEPVRKALEEALMATPPLQPGTMDAVVVVAEDDDDVLDGDGEDDEEVPPADLSTVPDEQLEDEVARRVATAALDELVENGLEADPAEAIELHDIAVEEVAEALADALAEVVGELMGDDTVEDEGPELEDDEENSGDLEPVQVIGQSGRGMVPDMRDYVSQIVKSPGVRNVIAQLADKKDQGTVPVPGSVKPFDWEGILTIEGEPSGDGRMIGLGALTWRILPIPLMSLTENTSDGHKGSVVCGSIVEIERVGTHIIGRGYFARKRNGDLTPDAEVAMDLLADGTMRGVSADIDSVKSVFADPSGNDLTMDEAVQVSHDGGDVVEMLVEGRIMGATLCPFPAFQEAFVYLLENADLTEALVASGALSQGDVYRVTVPLTGWHWNRDGLDTSLDGVALVASAAAQVDDMAPPSAYFDPEEMLEPEPFQVHAPDENGIVRVYGLVAQKGTCHIGFSGECVLVPDSDDFRKFYTGKKVLTAEGTLVPTGPIFMGDKDHPDVRLAWREALKAYAKGNNAHADVRLYMNEWGIVAAGVIRPDTHPWNVRRLRASDISPDWRIIDDELKLVALLAVNCSGFLVEDGLVASGVAQGRHLTPRGFYDSVSGKVTALVAAGAIHREVAPSGEAVTLQALWERTGRLEAIVMSLTDDDRDERMAGIRAAFGWAEEKCLPCERSERLGMALGVFGIEPPPFGETPEVIRRNRALAVMGLVADGAAVPAEEAEAGDSAPVGTVKALSGTGDADGRASDITITQVDGTDKPYTQVAGNIYQDADGNMVKVISSGRPPSKGGATLEEHLARVAKEAAKAAKRTAAQISDVPAPDSAASGAGIGGESVPAAASVNRAERLEGAIAAFEQLRDDWGRWSGSDGNSPREGDAVVPATAAEVSAAQSASIEGKSATSMTDAEKIRAAEIMYGSGSAQHEAAKARFGPGASTKGSFALRSGKRIQPRSSRRFGQ